MPSRRSRPDAELHAHPDAWACPDPYVIDGTRMELDDDQGRTTASSSVTAADNPEMIIFGATLGRQIPNTTNGKKYKE